VPMSISQMCFCSSIISRQLFIRAVFVNSLCVCLWFHWMNKEFTYNLVILF
jgi:hypothetical protein